VNVHGFYLDTGIPFKRGQNLVLASRFQLGWGLVLPRSSWLSCNEYWNLRTYRW